MSEEKPLDRMKKNIVDAAAAAIVEQMTPEQMKMVAEQVIGEVISTIKTSEYSSLGRLIGEKAEAALREHLRTEEIQDRLRVAVRLGVDEALKEMPEQVKGRVLDVALDVMVKALTSKSDNRWR
jgi:alkyl hydroperoxide reductase subunit AhpF